ncbi:putative aldouronate transport system substrate-binding protein [Actinoalloteichus hoggarensis]|uniref:extracellular solute-binding protein n=1 Tax=Actinoalloteichus hoggarensis TaxID=1470176 RepID=UPI000B8B5664|nr:extracellular solute-binding protein [Actinoalloteichus hoggarensis]MBB5920293.1 putative aldouronate transport system substrate-binding protein [Actinoalloteichus hoggarensis]
MNRFSESRISRRTLLSALGAGAAVTAAGPLLSACSSGGGGSTPGGSVTDEDSLGALLPSYSPIEYAAPDLPGVLGSVPGYTSYPAELIRAVAEPPGTGGEVTAMTPAYWPLAPSDNAYYRAVNERLGADVSFSVVNGSDYAARLNAQLAGGQLPELTVIPDWDVPARFGEAVGSSFTDLTEYLQGDAAHAYPHLANLPTRAWAYCVWNEGLRAVPTPAGLFPLALYHRRDLFEQAGLAPPRSADDLYRLCTEITDPDAGRWACGNIFLEVKRMFNVPAEWSRDSAGNLVNEAETESFAEAVAFMARLFEEGHVHPTVAGSTTGQEKELFESGAMWMLSDGMGAWQEALARQLPSNPTFDMRPFPAFSHDGGEPVYYTQEAANLMTFLRSDLPRERVEELLRILDFCAAPIGSEENHLINYGVDGEHSERDAAGAPSLTDLGSREITVTYGFLAKPPYIVDQSQYPGYVEAMHAWEAEVAPFQVDKLTDGLRIEEPPRLTGLAQQLDDRIQDLLRGRTSVSELPSVLDGWRRDGGDELREFYAAALDEAGR